MNQFLHVGSLDGEAMIEMNNVAVGYLTPNTATLCTYPPLMPMQVISIQVGPLPADATTGADTAPVITAPRS